MDDSLCEPAAVSLCLVSMVKHIERFRAAMNFQPVDRLPRWEWVMWRSEIIARWKLMVAKTNRCGCDLGERTYGTKSSGI